MIKQIAINEALDEIQELAKLDTYILTRDEVDTIFYHIENVRKIINEIYQKKSKRI